MRPYTLKHDKKIVSISVLYNSDEINGIAFTVEDEAGLNQLLDNLEHHFTKAYVRAVRKYGRASQIAYFKSELERIGRALPASFNVVSSITIIGMVLMLAKEGELVDDAFNGILLAVEDYKH